MEIEWATICGQVEPYDGQVHLLGALSEVHLIGEAQSEVTAHVALIIRAQISEISEGGFVTVVHVVSRRGQIVTRGRTGFAYPSPDMTLVPSLTQARVAFDVLVPFPVTEYGAYDIGLTIDGDFVWSLRYHILPQSAA